MIPKALLFKQFLKRPLQVASVVPSSRTLVRMVADKMDFLQPRIIVEFGPGDGCHTREIMRRMHPDSRLLLFELCPALAQHLQNQFHDDPRVMVLNTDAANLHQELSRHDIAHCDYVLSGIPFSILETSKKRTLLQSIYDCLTPAPHAAFIIYQVTNELLARGHCSHFPSAQSKYCLRNIPPLFVTKFYRIANSHAQATRTTRRAITLHRIRRLASLAARRRSQAASSN